MPPKAKRIDSKLESLPKAKAAFIDPMLLLRAGALPDGAQWPYELTSSARKVLMRRLGIRAQ